jgi:hypothetical protein
MYLWREREKERGQSYSVNKDAKHVLTRFGGLKKTNFLRPSFRPFASPGNWKMGKKHDQQQVKVTILNIS